MKKYTVLVLAALMLAGCGDTSKIDKIIEEKQTTGELNEHLFLSGYNPDGKIVYYAIDLKE